MQVGRFVPAVALAVLVASAAGAQEVPQTFDWHEGTAVPSTTPWGQAVDVESSTLIRSWTTMPEYTNPTVDHLPEHPTVISPTDHFGHPIGKPGVLHKVEEVYGYMDALAGSSPRVSFQRLGQTEEGRDFALVQVGSEENLARLDAVRDGMGRLADPRSTSAEDAAELVAELPAIYAFYAGLHSTETGPPEMVMEMAYRLAVSDDPMIQAIRDSVVVFIVPVAEPDGRDKVVDWHRRYNADVYDGDDRVPGPPYWGKYIFHDNNRDGLQLSAKLTQQFVSLFLDWHFPVGHDLHESVPYLYVSTGTGPYNPTVDPITVSEWQWMSNWEVTNMTAEGMPGVWTHGFYTGWYPGYLLWVTNTRNAVGRFYETFGNSVPNTMQRTLGSNATDTEWYRPNPPRDTTIWSLRNNTNYMQTGALNAVYLVAQNRSRVLDNFWRKSVNAVEKGRTEAPYGYVIPADQARRADASYMLNLMQRQGIEVHQADDDATFGEVAVAEGDYVVRMDQPYRNFVQTLMETQDFPDDAPSPYDDVAWTYPLMFNVTAHAVDDEAIQDLDMDPVDGEVMIAGSYEHVDGDDESGVRVVVPNASAHIMAARLALPADVAVVVADEEITVDDERTVPAGAWLMRPSEISEDDFEAWATEHGFTAYTIEDTKLGEAAHHPMDMPRVAVLHTWSRTQDEGWTRFTFDQAGLEYDYISEKDLAGLNLRSRYDVVVFPHQSTRATAKSIFQGVDPKFSPLAYTRTEEFPSHGTPDSDDDITGGMGFGGLQALRDFVDGGGTLIAIGTAGTIPVEYGFLREVSFRPRGSMFIPGSILQGEISNPSDPLTYGYEETLPLYHQFGPYLNVSDDEEHRVPVKYTDGTLLLSGAARSANSLKEDPAIYSAPVGDGHVVIYGFDALHRHQNHGNHALVWNAILNWNDLGTGQVVDDTGVVAPQAGN